MTWYLGLTTTRKIIPFPGEEKERGEFAVVRQLEALGIEAFTPRKIEFKRQGKRRHPDAIASPYLPGYVFLNATPEQFYQALECRGLARTLMALREGDLRGSRYLTSQDGKTASQKRTQAFLGVLDFREYAEAKEAEAQKIVERNDRAAMAQFDPGDVLEMIAGPFMHRAVRFIRMVDASGQMPMLEVEIEMFGGTTRGKVDPLDVKKRATG